MTPATDRAQGRAKAREALSSIDSAWLRMEDPTNLMTITGVLSIEEPVPFDEVKRVIADRFLAHRRFRQRVVESRVPFVAPRWEEDDQFALQRHLHRTALPAPGDQTVLQDLVSDLMSTPLDLTRPLWQMHVVEGYRGGTALVVRVHHAIGDGMSLLPVLLGITESADGARAKDAVGVHAVPRPQGRQGGGAAGEPGVLTLPKKLLDMAVAGGGGAWTLGRLAALSSDPASPFKGQLGTDKRAAWSDAIELDRVKSLCKKLGATLNDVLLAAVAGALRFYLQERGMEPPPGLEMRAVVPVNLRPPGDDSLGNRFGLVFLPLPLGTADPRERLAILKRRMDEIKSSPEAMVTYAVLQVMGATSAELEERALQFFGKKATAVATNMPGPREPLYLCGKRLRSIMFWVPQSGRLGLGVSILSYAGTVRIGIATDAGLVPHPEQIVAAYHRALDELGATVATA